MTVNKYTIKFTWQSIDNSWNLDEYSSKMVDDG